MIFAVDERLFCLFMHKILIFLSVLLWCGAVNAAEIPSYDTAWLKLLHYHKTLNGYQGLVENQEFYISADGRNNPQAEFAAEIEAFSKGNAKCRFPARFNYLKQLGKVQGDLSGCKDYQQFMHDVRPNGITILFTNAYMSNPASLFGHTLVRIDTARKGTQMLAHGSNFGADSGTEHRMMFAIKGLFGGYLGVYSVSPYWEIINTYNNIENRDIWEYSLNLTDEEKQKFADHLYEMRQAKIRYYFLSKNCSYLILELLEAVRPSLKLTKQYPAWVIPLDTLKTINNEPNLVKSQNYRPARYTQIQNLLKAMNNEQYQAFLRGIEKYDFAAENLTDEEKSAVYEAVYQYFQYEYTAGNMPLKEYRKASFGVLRKRSALPIVEKVQPVGENPVLSHDSMQISLSGGSERHKSFEEIEVRPAYTALTDSSFGLVKGAEISVMSSKWRYYNQSHKTVLQNFAPIKIKSLVPAGRVFDPISYAVGAEIKRDYNPQNYDEGYVGYGYGGVGKTIALPANIWLYGLLKINGAYGGFIPHNSWGGFAPEIGILKDFGAVRMHFNAEKTWATRKFGNRLIYKAAASLGITDNLSLEIGYEGSHNIGRNSESWQLWLRQSF